VVLDLEDYKRNILSGNYAIFEVSNTIIFGDIKISINPAKMNNGKITLL
jgi:hypothetical protein